MGLEYTYAPTMRALRTNAGPKGHIRMESDDGRGPFGVIVYPRPLSKKEIEGWALSTVDMPRIPYNVFGVCANGNLEFLLLWNEEIPGVYDAAVTRADNLGRSGEFIDYVVKPYA